MLEYSNHIVDGNSVYYPYREIKGEILQKTRLGGLEFEPKVNSPSLTEGIELVILLHNQ